MRTDSTTSIIAGAGVDHNGTPTLANSLINVAVETGAAKFQTFRAKQVVSRGAPRRITRLGRPVRGESWFELICELDWVEMNFWIR